MTPTVSKDDVERVARAMHQAFAPYSDYSYPWEDPLSSKDMFLDLARAAITALSTDKEEVTEKLSRISRWFEGFIANGGLHAEEELQIVRSLAAMQAAR